MRAAPARAPAESRERASGHRPWFGDAGACLAAREALAMALDHALGEALRREAPRELGTLQLDRGNDGARHRLAVARSALLVFAPVDLRGLQFLPGIALGVAADHGLGHDLLAGKRV